MESDFFISDNNESMISDRLVDNNADVSKLEESYSEMHSQMNVGGTERGGKVRNREEGERKTSNISENTGNSPRSSMKPLKSALSATERKDSTNLEDLTPRKGKKPVIRYKDQEDD